VTNSTSQLNEFVKIEVSLYDATTVNLKIHDKIDAASTSSLEKGGALPAKRSL
jgi:hypothetical protein